MKKALKPFFGFLPSIPIILLSLPFIFIGLFSLMTSSPGSIEAGISKMLLALCVIILAVVLFNNTFTYLAIKNLNYNVEKSRSLLITSVALNLIFYTLVSFPSVAIVIASTAVIPNIILVLVLSSSIALYIYIVRRIMFEIEQNNKKCNTGEAERGQQISPKDENDPWLTGNN